MVSWPLCGRARRIWERVWVRGAVTPGFFFFLDSFLRWIIFKVFIEFVIIFFLFYVLGFLAMSHMGSQLPDQGSNPHPLHWKVRF